MSRRQFLGQFVAGAAALALSGCGFWSRAEPQPRATATPPRPTPAVTPTPAPVRLEPPPSVVPPAPTTPPVLVTRPVGTPAASPTALPAFSGGGQLLYSGTIDGQRGIILADLAANTRKLLTAGSYEALAWSPDGSRFAALGIVTSEVQIQQLAIFAADGRALARYPIPLAAFAPRYLQWSPNGRALLYRVSDQSSPAQTTWIVDDTGQRSLSLGTNSFAWGWLPNGRLAGYTLSSTTNFPADDRPLTIWTVDPLGNDRRDETSGAFLPFGWSPDGTVIYGIGGFLPPGAGVRPGLFATSVVALDLIRDTRRTLVDTTVGPAGDTAWINGAAVAPGTGALTLVRARIPVSAQQNTVGVVSELQILDADGQLLASDLPWQDPIGTFSTYWSPNGLRLAYHAIGAGGGNSELRVLSRIGESRTVYPVRAADPRLGVLAVWSADERLLAYVDAGANGLIVAEPGTSRSASLAADGTFPAWRPRT